jgi:hypothetical protein
VHAPFPDVPAPAGSAASPSLTAQQTVSIIRVCAGTAPRCRGRVRRAPRGSTERQPAVRQPQGRGRQAG